MAGRTEHVSLRVVGRTAGSVSDAVNLQAIDNLLSGRDRTLPARTLRGLLSLASPVYGLGTIVRNMAFDRGWKTVHRVMRPVISIGNLTTGGTGKTPVVAWTVRQLQMTGVQPAIVSRGYRSLDGVANDEKRLLDILCPHVPHIQHVDRVAAAQRAIVEAHAEGIVLDDGLQHRRLHRDLDVILVDALNPWGYGHLLPRGLLREPKRGLQRAGLVLLTRVDQADPRSLETLRNEIRRLTGAPLAEVRFVAAGLRTMAGESRPLSSLSPERTGAFCGIGNPLGFRRTLQDAGLEMPDNRFRIFADHHDYSPADLRELGQWVRDQGLEAVVMTQKDQVKLGDADIGAPLLALELEVDFVSGEQTAIGLIRQVLAAGDPS